MEPRESRPPARSLFLLSFNRPDYLRTTLDSLQHQTDRNWQIFLCQDGPRADHLDDDLCAIGHCVELFRERFPEGRIVRKERNMGIGLNMLGAQQHAFKELDLDVAYFFEDDLVLHHRYIEQLVLLEEALRPHQKLVPYFAAYGTVHTVRIPQTALVNNDMRYMEHLWAFGLFRSHWEEEQQLLKEYFDYLSQVDYSQRDHQRILGMFCKLGWTYPYTSQDGARMVALCVMGRCALSTRQPLAHYIGQSGTHWNSCDYRAWGFPDVHPATDAIPVIPELSEENILQLTEGFRRWACTMRDLPLRALRQALEQAEGQDGLHLPATPEHPESEIARLHRRIRALENSTSWRLTGPLRSAAGRIQRMFQQRP